MCVCVCVCVLVGMCMRVVDACVHVRVCVYAYLCVYVWARACARECVYMLVCMHVCVSVFMIVRIDTRVRSSIYISLCLVWFDLVLWHINQFRLFNAESIFIHINNSISNNSV